MKFHPFRSARLTGFSLAKVRFSYAFAAALWLLAAAGSQAGLTLQLDLIDNESLGAFTCSPNLSTNANGSDATPLTYHQVRSPNSQFIGDLPGNSFDLRNQFTDFNAFTQELTNGNWTLILNVGATNEHTYRFTVSITNLTINTFGNVAVDYPADGAPKVAPLPNFAWHGPTNWDNVLLEVYDPSFAVFNFTNVPAATTNATLPPALPSGPYTFGVDFSVNASALIASSTPHDASNNSAPGWVSTLQLEHGNSASFNVLAPPVDSTGPLALVAHYPLDASKGLNTDTSGNGYDLATSYFNAGPAPTSTTNRIAGDTAALLNGANWFIFPTNLLPTIAGTFSISLWINTSQIVGSDNDQGSQDAGIVWADVGDQQNDSIPMALTGSKLGFFTGNPDVTVNSAASINSGPGSFTHVVVTRDQFTGIKNIYVNGVFDATGVGSTNVLNDSTEILLGMNPFNFQGVVGAIDDVQIYSGILNPSDVAFIFQNPGIPTAPRSSGLLAHYAFDNTNNVGADISGDGFDLDFNGDFVGNGVTLTNDAEAGGYAAFFDGGSFLTYSSTPSNILNALAGDFTLTVWVKTTNTYGNNSDPGYTGLGIVAADIPGPFNDLVPMAQNGGVIGFNTGPNDDTLHCSAQINDGKYHQVVVTRTRATGGKQIYIDGALDSSDTATTNLLNDPVRVAVGAQIDASQSDPNNSNPDNYYSGLLDDIQLYSRVLSAGEIAWLYQNPGAAISGPVAAPQPVSVDMTFTVYREQDPVFGDIFVCFPFFNTISPALITTNYLSSPNNLFNTTQIPGNSSSGSGLFYSLNQVISECTNGLWTLNINQGDPSAQVFYFTASVSGLTTNILPPVKILVPANGAIGVATNTPFAWSGGVADFTNVNISKQIYGGGDSASLALDPSATNWPAPPTLDPGTNRFDVDYMDNNFTGITFTVPVDGYLRPVSNWVTQVALHSTSYSAFVVGIPQVYLLNTAVVGTNLQFTFTPIIGRTNYIESSTNLAAEAWMPCTNFVGDGSVQTIVVPASSPTQRFFRLRTP
jgi:hypothetical protein